MGRGERRQARAWRAGRDGVEGSARLLAALVRAHACPPADAPEPAQDADANGAGGIPEPQEAAAHAR